MSAGSAPTLPSSQYTRSSPSDGEAPPTIEHDPSFLERFELRRMLGEGSFGTVYEAWDRRASIQVAIKVLQRLDAEDVLRFKREFRALHGIVHPNLVELRELIQSGGRWYLVMELVEGWDLLTWVWGREQPIDLDSSGPTDKQLGKMLNEVERSGSAPQVNADRLRMCLAQLAKGLMALHESGRLHRDIKPTNIRVTPEGRLVLLDFGLVTGIKGAAVSTVAHLVGTAAYMAPEQALTNDLDPATDWYATGALLFHALTGSVPFGGNSMQMLMEKQRVDGPRPGEHRSNIPDDLDSLTAELMRKDPRERANGGSILEIVSLSEEPSLQDVAHTLSRTSSSGRSARFVGREPELARLRGAFDTAMKGQIAIEVVLGESGIGKTRLVDRFLREIRLDRSQTLVLRGRCFENESVPYKALDGAIDELCQELRRMENDSARALLPKHAGSLPILFPMLARVGPIVELGRPDVERRDPLALRAEVFAALRTVLLRVAERRPLILVLEDLQWADDESMSLLAELTRPPNAPSMVVLAAARDLPNQSAVVQRGVERLVAMCSEGKAMELAELSHKEAVRMALSLLGEGEEESAEQIARSAEGHPLFIETLVRYRLSGGDGLGHSLDAALAEELRRMDDHAAEIFGLCCLAGLPLERRALQDAVGSPATEFDAQLASLRSRRLIQITPREGGDMIEVAHNRILRTLVDSLPAEQLPRMHGRIARVLKGSTPANPQQLARHWFLSGDVEQAQSAAEAAGNAAAEVLNFAESARLYAWAIELRGDEVPRRLHLKLAEALNKAGHCSKAAEAFLAAIPGSSGAEVIDLRRRAAELLIQSGRMDEGLKIGGALLESLGLALPKSRSGAIASMLWHWMRRKFRGDSFNPRDESEVPHDELIRIDVLWSLSSALGALDFLKAGSLQIQHFILALNAGESGRIAQAMATDVMGLYFTGQRGKVPARIEEAKALADETGRAEVRAVVRYFDGLTSNLEGNAAASVVRYGQCVELLEAECPDQPWLLSTAQAGLLSALCEVGDWRQLAERFPPILAQVRGRGDAFSIADVLLWSAFAYYLMLDEPEHALEALHTGLEYSKDADAHLVTSAHARYCIDLYIGDKHAHIRCLERFDELRSRGALRTPKGSRLVHLMMGLATLASAGPGASKGARKLLQRMKKKEENPQGVARGSMLLEAAILNSEGNLSAAASLLKRSAARCLGGGAQLDAWAATALRSQILGRSTDELEAFQVEADLRERGVLRPMRFLHALSIGLVAAPRKDA